MTARSASTVPVNASSCEADQGLDLSAARGLTEHEDSLRLVLAALAGECGWAAASAGEYRAGARFINALRSAGYIIAPQVGDMGATRFVIASYGGPRQGRLHRLLGTADNGQLPSHWWSPLQSCACFDDITDADLELVEELSQRDGRGWWRLGPHDLAAAVVRYDAALLRVAAAMLLSLPPSNDAIAFEEVIGVAAAVLKRPALM